MRGVALCPTTGDLYDRVRDGDGDAKLLLVLLLLLSTMVWLRRKPVGVVLAWRSLFGRGMEGDEEITSMAFALFGRKPADGVPGCIPRNPDEGVPGCMPEADLCERVNEGDEEMVSMVLL